jgi:hypothetical protein
MTNVLSTSFSHTYSGKETYDIINNAYSGQGSLIADWRVLQNITSKSNLYYSDGFDKILKPYSTSWNPPANQLSLSDRVINVADVEVNLNISRDVIKSTVWEELTRSGAMRDNLSSTPILDFVTSQVKTALGRDVFRQVMFNKASSGNDDWKAFDGLFTQLAAGGSGIVRYNISPNVTSGALNTDAALIIFKKLVEGADPRLNSKSITERAIYCTGSLLYNYMTTLETGAHDFAKLEIINGRPVFHFRGIEIIPVWDWDTWIADAANPNSTALSANGGHFAMYTEKRNLVVGTDIGVAEYGLQIEYVMYQKTLFIQTMMKLGTNFVSGKNTRVAY